MGDLVADAWKVRLEIDRRIAHLEAIRDRLNAQFAGEVVLDTTEAA
jgi:hypothetical protein